MVEHDFGDASGISYLLFALNYLLGRLPQDKNGFQLKVNENDADSIISQFSAESEKFSRLPQPVVTDAIIFSNFSEEFIQRLPDSNFSSSQPPVINAELNWAQAKYCITRNHPLMTA